MKKGEFPDLIKKESTQKFLNFMTQQLKNLIQTTDVEYVVFNTIGKNGNPVVCNINIKAANSKNY